MVLPNIVRRRLFIKFPTIGQRGISTTRNEELKQNRMLASYYRGGTSRGIMFNSDHLPASRDDWKPIFLGTIGSPDPNGRQLDGLGGGISSLSKICVVGRSSTASSSTAATAAPDGGCAQVDFTFVQVGVKNDGIDYSGNCGNLSSAIGPYAVDSGMVKVRADSAGETETTVRIYNTNTDKYIDATFPVVVDGDGNAEAVAKGEFDIDGVSGTGARVKLDFLYPGGSKTGKTLPTGNVIDVIDGVRTSCLDVGNPTIFVPASELGGEGHNDGIDGTMSPGQIQAVPGLLKRLESIRVQAAVAMGMAKSVDEVPASIPKVGIVSKPVGHVLLSGRRLEADDVDVVVRAISVGQPHGALPITSGLAMGVAARLEGSVVHECLGDRQTAAAGGEFEESELAVGHASGRLVVGAKMKLVDGEVEVERATVYRTARRLMDGFVYWK